jgi:spermidine/putrescine transport system permease protein
MVLPIAAALRAIDPCLPRAAHSLGAAPWRVFLRVTLPLSISGVFAASLLSFIPAVGDYLNAELLGSRNETMIGNVIQRLYLVNNDYPQASALSMILMLGILVSVFIYRRILRGQELTV